MQRLKDYNMLPSKRHIESPFPESSEIIVEKEAERL